MVDVCDGCGSEVCRLHKRIRALEASAADLDIACDKLRAENAALTVANKSLAESRNEHQDNYIHQLNRADAAKTDVWAQTGQPYDGACLRVAQALANAEFALPAERDGWVSLDEDETVALLTEAMRAADQAFEKSGGSTRHYVRGYLMPQLKRMGLVVARPGAWTRAQARKVAACIESLLASEDP